MGPLWGPVVPLQVLQETQEQSVHGHGVDTEEGTGNEVTADSNEDNWSPTVVQSWNIILK